MSVGLRKDICLIFFLLAVSVFAFSLDNPDSYEGKYLIAEFNENLQEYELVNKVFMIEKAGPAVYRITVAAFEGGQYTEYFSSIDLVEIKNNRLKVTVQAYTYNLSSKNYQFSGMRKYLYEDEAEKKIALYKVDPAELAQQMFNSGENREGDVGYTYFEIDDEDFLFPSEWVEINRSGRFWDIPDSAIKINLREKDGTYFFSIEYDSLHKEEFVIDQAIQDKPTHRRFVMVNPKNGEYIEQQLIYEDGVEGVARWFLPELGYTYFVHDKHIAAYLQEKKVDSDSFEDDSRASAARDLISRRGPVDVEEKHTIHNPYDEDWFIFYANPQRMPEIRTFSAGNGNDVSTVIRIISNRREEILTSSNSRNGFAFINRAEWGRLVSRGRYFCVVSSLEGETGEYILKIEY